MIFKNVVFCSSLKAYSEQLEFYKDLTCIIHHINVEQKMLLIRKGTCFLYFGIHKKTFSLETSFELCIHILCKTRCVW